MEQAILTRGEMERSLSQYIQAFYRERLGCKTRKVSCHILDNKMAIAIENSITPVEKLLNNHGDSAYTQDLRTRIDAIVKNQLPTKLEEILGVKINSLAIDTTLDRGFTGMVALLAEAPALRSNKPSKTPRHANK